MEDNENIVDAYKDSLDLYVSAIKFRDKNTITLSQYHTIHEAIESIRKTLHILERTEANEDKYFTEQRNNLQEKLDELMLMSEYFSEEDRVVYKPKRKIERRKKRMSKKLALFYGFRHSFLERYAKALMLQKKDMITITQYADLLDDVEFGKRALKESFPLTQGSSDKKFMKDRDDLVSRVSEIYRIGKRFWENCRVVVDYEWVDMDWSQ